MSKASTRQPRDRGIDEAIVAATLRLFATGGYGRISIEDIADEAGVTRPTVYRRYRNKHEAVRAALHSVAAELEPLRYTGDLRADLTFCLERLKQLSDERDAMSLVGAVLVEEHHNPELLELFRESIVQPRRRVIRELLLTAAAHGQMRRDVDYDMVADYLVGIWYASYTSVATIPDDWAARAVATLLPALLPAG